MQGYLSEVQGFAGTYTPTHWRQCDGRTYGATESGFDLNPMSILLGGTFGGNGNTNVGMPNLAGIPATQGPPIRQLICVKGLYPGSNVSGTVGEIRAFAGSRIPNVWPVCDGRIVQASGFRILYSVIGNKFGGMEPTSFGFPNISPQVVQGAPRGVPYLVCENGISPSFDEGRPSVDGYLGQVRLFAGDRAPSGWAFCRGQLLQITPNPYLFTVLNTRYGGDGLTTFGLPDVTPHTAGTATVEFIICINGIYPSRP